MKLSSLAPFNVVPQLEDDVDQALSRISEERTKTSPVAAGEGQDAPQDALDQNETQKGLFRLIDFVAEQRRRQKKAKLHQPAAAFVAQKYRQLSDTEERLLNLGATFDKSI